MRKWEYTTLECKVNSEGRLIGTDPNWYYLDTLNRMGQEGWDCHVDDLH
jgi:hypothetical protein